MDDLYSILTGRTVLSVPLPPQVVSVTTQIPADTNSAITFIEGELAKHRIECVPEGDKFVKFLPTYWKDTPLKTSLARVKPLAKGSAKSPVGTINFPSAPLDQVLDMYSQVRNRTILHSALPAVAIHLASQQPLTREELIYALETTLALNNMAVVEDGEKFVQVVPIYLVSQVQARSPKPKPGQPAGSINLPCTSLEQTLEIYAKMRNRTLLRPAAMPLVMVQLACQQSLTQEEAVYALETILLLHNLAVVEDGEKFVQVVPIQQASQVQARAPKPKPGTALIEPAKVPQFPPSLWVALTPRLLVAPKAKSPTLTDRAMEYYVWVYKKVYGHAPPPPPPPDVDKLVNYYAKLAGLDALPSKQFGKMPVVLEVRTPLAKAELLYAIETTLALNNLEIVHVDKNSICAGHISETHRLETNSSAFQTEGKK